MNIIIEKLRNDISHINECNKLIIKRINDNLTTIKGHEKTLSENNDYINECELAIKRLEE